MSLSNSYTGTTIVAPFKVQVAQPIDTRFVVDTISDRDNIDTKYDGLIVYVKEESTYYRYHEKTDSFTLAITNMHSAEGFPSIDLGDIGDWALNEAGSLYHKEKRSDNTIQWVPKAIMGSGGSESGGGVSTVNIGVSFSSIDSMNNNIGSYAEGTIAILNLDINDEDNGKIFKKTVVDNVWVWQYLGKITGPAGLKGEDGKSITFRIGNVTTGISGTEAIVENVGDENNVILNITIPKGKDGLEGKKGEKGDKGDPGNPTIINGISPTNDSINLTLDNIPDGKLRSIGITVEEFGG